MMSVVVVVNLKHWNCSNGCNPPMVIPAFQPRALTVTSTFTFTTPLADVKSATAGTAGTTAGTGSANILSRQRPVHPRSYPTPAPTPAPGSGSGSGSTSTGRWPDTTRIQPPPLPTGAGSGA
jgi:hypothetical protein